ncbi:MAG: glutathione S-transferase family protein [Qingshengfaniella sp.]
MTLTLYHAPHSRSSRIISLLYELQAQDKVTVIPTSIPRQDGSGQRDPANPHPEGKVPLLIHDGVAIRESGAIILYLTELFPEAGLGVPVGDPRRGRFLSWLFYYGNVLEPVMVHSFAGLSHPALNATFRGMPKLADCLSEALADGPYLMGATYNAADLLLASPFGWFSDLIPDRPEIRAWVDRCMARDALRQAGDYDARLLQSA